jgi:hypothetical protein
MSSGGDILSLRSRDTRTEMVEEFAKNIEMVSSFLGLSPAGTGSTIPGDHQ